MSPSPISGHLVQRPLRAAPRLLLVLFAVLLCGAVGTSFVPGPPLEEGLTLEREIRSGETHAYPVALEAGQFLRVLVQERGVDLTLRLLDPQGNPATVADSLSRGRAEAMEDLAAVAGATGSYRLEVTAGEGGSCLYSLRIEGPRTPGENDEKRAEAVAATWRGLIEPKGNTGAQVHSLETALALWQSLQETGKSAETLFALGLMKSALPEHGPAALHFQQAAELWSHQSGRAGKLLQASALTNMARCLKNADRRQEAREAHERAFVLAREAGDYDLQAENLDNLGLMETEDGEIRKALDLQLQALELTRQAGNRSHEAVILNNLAGAYDLLAEPQKALKFYQQALELVRSNPKKGSELTYLNNIGDMYRTLGDWEKALDYFQRSSELSRSAGKPVLRGKILINLALAYRRHLGQTAQARSLLEEALELGRETNALDVQTFALTNLAALEIELKNPAQAVKHAREAVSLGASSERETISRYFLGRALREHGDPSSAQAELEKALSLARKYGKDSSEADIRLELARVKRDQGDPASALSQIQTAIERIESRRDGVISPELRASFLASMQDYYELQVDTLMALHAARATEGFAADALRMNEKARARGLLEILNEAGADIRLGASPALIAQEQETREELNARDWYRRELLAGDSTDARKLAEADQRLREALDAYEKVQVELREGNPRYTALTEPQPLDAAEIQRQVLDGEALLLEYALGAKRSFLWAVGPDSLASFELPERDRIEKVARRYYELLTVRNNRLPGESLPAWKKRITQADAEAGQAGRELAGLILQPVEKLLGNRPLLIVADGALQYIPFAALPIPSTGAPLMTRHEVVSLPSASALAVIRREMRERPRAPRTLAMFADPVFQEDDERLSPRVDRADPLRLSQKTSSSRGDAIDLSTLRRLTFSQKEADTIAALVPSSEVFKAVGFAASRETVANAGLDAYRNVHFATHGVVDSHHPELSGLVLSLYNEKGERQDGFLRLNHIYNLRLDADLVVLSACRTALGKEIRGEGLVGLTRGFMYAGASRVLASLWSVEDRATAELMGNFYRGMLREGLSPAAALRKAQLEMAKKPQRSSPYYWAGFSLQGEWR